MLSKSKTIPFFLLMLMNCITINGLSQNMPDTSGINRDSIEKELDLFLSMYQQKKERSYFTLSLALNNTQLSINNFALNAQQNNPGLTFSPTIEYMHRSGLNISYNHFFLLNNQSSGIIQHSINPGYLFAKNKRFDFGIFYTYFITNQDFTKYASPYQHDVYTYLQWNSKWLQPSLSIGYATGNYKENNSTTEKLLVTRPYRGDTTIQFTVYDSLEMKIKDISSIVSISKKFIFQGKKLKRYIVFTPSVLAMFVQNNYDIVYKSASEFSPRTQLILNNRPQLAQIIRGQLSAQFPNLNQTRGFLNSSDFVLQSIGVNLTATAYFGSFFVAPRIYLDCYMLSNDEKFNLFFSLRSGIIF